MRSLPRLGIVTFCPNTTNPAGQRPLTHPEPAPDQRRRRQRLNDKLKPARKWHRSSSDAVSLEGTDPSGATTSPVQEGVDDERRLREMVVGLDLGAAVERRTTRRDALPLPADRLT